MSRAANSVVVPCSRESSCRRRVSNTTSRHGHASTASPAVCGRALESGFSRRRTEQLMPVAFAMLARLQCVAFGGVRVETFDFDEAVQDLRRK